MRCTSKSCAVLVLTCSLCARLFRAPREEGQSTTLTDYDILRQSSRSYATRAVEDYENLYLERCNEDWRAAVKEDPNLAVAWAWIAFNSGNPAGNQRCPREGEGTRAQDYSRRTVDGCLGFEGAGRRLHRRHYRHERHAGDVSSRQARLYLAGNWLMGENGDEQAQHFMEKALAIDKNFPAALNDLAYVEARNRQFDKAFAAMDRYVALLPKSPIRRTLTANSSAWREISTARSRTIRQR